MTRLRDACNLGFILCVSLLVGSRGRGADIGPNAPGHALIRLADASGQTQPLGEWKAGDTVRVLAWLDPDPEPEPDPKSEPDLPPAKVELAIEANGLEPIRKALHAGDPDCTLYLRLPRDGPLTLSLARSPDGPPHPACVRVEWDRVMLSDADRDAIEVEPNDTWRQANPLRLGRDVYGTADDVDYLENLQEGKAGLDWFRFEVAGPDPILAFFVLDLLDRDVSANLRVYSVSPETGEPTPYHEGKDPTEVVHDRERERYSKQITRTFQPGVYYLEVNANHPSYILRTRVLPVPPYDDPTTAVEAGAHYLMNAGDAWFAQVPREGNIFVRSNNLHETATRCTACHASSFPTEAALAAHRAGYPIRAKDGLQYVMDRIANSVAPLYGSDGLYWQRFIAIPLQAQGKQGAILADYEREVTGRPTSALDRFGPFLNAAWSDRTTLPGDESNGVVPLDSRYGFAWRDWAVLRELARRTGRADYAKSAERIAALLGDRSADRRICNLQDRIHRLHAWWLIDHEENALKIKRETGALLALQNEDGGWHETDDGPGPSAIYTTGQLVETLLEVGLPRDHPAIARALRYLLLTQQAFGGWFQTTTHENFQTPMRETRYAVMALARAFPRANTPLRGWGNRDEGPARLPRTNSLIHALDDLENLWEVPENDRARFAAETIKFLSHPDPMVRASAAACLGRLERPEAVEPLTAALGDPSKIVWRAAAWALRRLGNLGLGVEAITQALHDPNPRVRRGAARIFAYQFQGMDSHAEIAERLMALTRDPDLWTRLQAVRSLRQWFYRTGDATLQRAIVETFLARLAEPTEPVVRKALSENLYSMLDENLGGGVSLQKNLAELPAVIAGHVMQARLDLERDVLILPLLGALERGNVLQRAGVLAAFDGSFFKGRSYARQPVNAIDVGNDREFGFLYQPELHELERSFRPLLEANPEPEQRRQAIALGSFFRLWEQTAEPLLQTKLLDALTDSNEGVVSEARKAVSSSFALKGAEDDPSRIARVRDLLRGDANPSARSALIAAIGRNPRLGAKAEIKDAIRAMLTREDAAEVLLPVLGQVEINDAERLQILDRGWDRLSTPQREQALALVRSRADSAHEASDRDLVLHILKRAIGDSSARVREDAYGVIKRLPGFWQSATAPEFVNAALADDTPAIRALGLSLAAARSSFWNRDDAVEHLTRLLVDPDEAVRTSALEIVKHHRLAALHPQVARRVKVLTKDPALVTRALGLLRGAGLDPDEIEADTPLSGPRLLRLDSFREKVNPYFYTAGDDGVSCAKCHGTHAILKLAPGGSAQAMTEDQVASNYASALKVINLGKPELSLLLRKPRSPQGQDNATEENRAALTHAGGVRWSGTDDPAYRAILDWIREASDAAYQFQPEVTATADSHSPEREPRLAADGDFTTIWQTESIGATPGYPHELTIDLGEPRKLSGLLYVPRQDSTMGRVRRYEVFASLDGKNWTSALASGEWADDSSIKPVIARAPAARFVKLRGLSEVNGGATMSAAELAIESAPVDRE